MASTSLQLQTSNKPLFSDVLWSRPEHKKAAGKLAIIGGSSSGFNSVSEAYAAATKAGAGTLRVLLPDSLKRMLIKLWPESEFAPSTKAGSFASNALAQWLDLATWADAVMLSGDLSKSSETAIILERFLEEYQGLITLAGDSVLVAQDSPSQLLEQTKLTLVLEINVLQHLLKAIRYPMPARTDQTIYQLADLLHALTQSYPWAIITEHEQLFFVGYGGNVSATSSSSHSLLAAGSAAAVWRLQQPTKAFAAMTSGLYELTNNSND